MSRGRIFSPGLLSACVIRADGTQWYGVDRFVGGSRRTLAKAADAFRAGSVMKMYTDTTTIRDLLSHRSGMLEVLSFPRMLLTSVVFPSKVWKLEEIVDDVARSLIPLPWGYERRPDCSSWATLSYVSGALATNARELAKFLRALADESVIGKAIYQHMSSFTEHRPPFTGYGHYDGRDRQCVPDRHHGDRVVSSIRPCQFVDAAAVG